MRLDTSMKLLIDADYIVYKACAGAEDEIDWGNDVIMVVSSYSRAKAFVDAELRKITDVFPFHQGDDPILLGLREF